MADLSNAVVVEKNVRFSNSCLWQDQKKYYEKKGLSAWEEEVPYYATSNPVIAESYAEQIIAFIQDWCFKHKEANKEPFYILELGAGTGKFSFYFLKKIQRIQKMLRLSHIEIRYVMSDVHNRTFDFWENHPAMRPFLESGLLDFSLFNVYESSEIKLHRSGKTIISGQLRNPLIVIANYIFDSIASDIFTVRQGQLFESLVTTTTHKENFQNKQLVNCENVSISYEEIPVNDRYYGNKFDEVLLSYQNTLQHTHFQFPIGALNALQNLNQLCSVKMLLISSDKGYSALDELDGCDYPSRMFSGSFHVMVNYHAIGEYFKRLNGGYRIQPFCHSLLTGVFSCGFLLDELPRTGWQAQKLSRNFSAENFLSAINFYHKNIESVSLETMIAFFKLSEWDPDVFMQSYDRLLVLCKSASPELLSYLIKNIHHIADNFYLLPSSHDVFFYLGCFFHDQRHYAKAAEYYTLSLLQCHESEQVLVNLGICYHELKKNEEALDCFKSALVLNEQSVHAKEWCEKLSVMAGVPPEAH